MLQYTIADDSTLEAQGRSGKMTLEVSKHWNARAVMVKREAEFSVLIQNHFQGLVRNGIQSGPTPVRVPAYLLEVFPGQGHCQGLMVVAYGGDIGFAEKGSDLTFTAFSLYAFSVSPLHVFFSIKNSYIF